VASKEHDAPGDTSVVAIEEIEASSGVEAPADSQSPQDTPEKVSQKTKGYSKPEPPKRAKSAFQFFAEEKRPDVMKELDTTDFSVVSKKVGELWKSLEEGEKLPFDARAKVAKEDYEKAKLECESQVNAAKQTSKRNLPDVEPPKKPKSAYMIFAEEKRAEIAKELDTKDITKMSKRVGEVWKSLGEELKAVFEARAKAALEEYELAKGDYSSRADVKEQAARDKMHKLKGEVAAATKEVAKATSRLEILQKDLAAAKANFEEVRQQNKAIAKKVAEGAKQQGTHATTPQKRATRPTSSSLPQDVKRARVLDGSLLTEAKELATALENLAKRPEMSGRTGEEMLKALRENDGLVNKAKNALVATAC